MGQARDDDLLRADERVGGIGGRLLLPDPLHVHIQYGRPLQSTYPRPSRLHCRRFRRRQANGQ